MKAQITLSKLFVRAFIFLYFLHSLTTTRTDRSAKAFWPKSQGKHQQADKEVGFVTDCSQGEHSLENHPMNGVKKGPILRWFLLSDSGEREEQLCCELVVLPTDAGFLRDELIC